MIHCIFIEDSEFANSFQFEKETKFIPSFKQFKNQYISVAIVDHQPNTFCFNTNIFCCACFKGAPWYSCRFCFFQLCMEILEPRKPPWMYLWLLSPCQVPKTVGDLWHWMPWWSRMQVAILYHWNLKLWQLIKSKKSDMQNAFGLTIWFPKFQISEVRCLVDPSKHY